MIAQADDAALVVVPPPQRIAPDTWTLEDVKALQETVAKDCTNAQFRVFVAACKRLNLDPFARQIVPIVQGGRMTPQVTIDGFRLIADRTHKYRGQLGPYWCGPDGEWRDVWLSDTPPVAAKVGVLRADFAEPLWGVARTASYRQEASSTWKRMPEVMIAKVAESLALRKAFPNELSGVYGAEEMEQAQTEQAEVIEAVESGPTQEQVAAKRDRKGLTRDQWATMWRAYKGNLVKIDAALEKLPDPQPEPDGGAHDLTTLHIPGTLS